MADEISKPQHFVEISEMPGSSVHFTSDHRLQVEFRIDDLIRKLAPGNVGVANCGGCHGCSGCSM